MVYWKCHAVHIKYIQFLSVNDTSMKLGKMQISGLLHCDLWSDSESFVEFSCDSSSWWADVALSMKSDHPNLASRFFCCLVAHTYVNKCSLCKHLWKSKYQNRLNIEPGWMPHQCLRGSKKHHLLHLIIVVSLSFVGLIVLVVDL